MGDDKSKSFHIRDEPVAILLIEGTPLLRLGLSALIKGQRGLKLLAAGRNPSQVLQLSRGQRPDVILLDVETGGGRGVELARDVRSSCPGIGLIAIGAMPGTDILALVKEGVSGFVLKDASINDLVAAIRAVASGQKILPAPLVEGLFCQIVAEAHRKCVGGLGDVKMTGREREIVDLIVAGLSNKEIGNRLCIATDTVKSHVHNILEKLSLRSRVEVAARARDRT